MRFAELIAPITAERFMSDFYGRKPLHLPHVAGNGRAALVSWSRMNELLALRSHWTAANIKLIMNSRPVAAEHYMKEVDTQDGRVRRADPAKSICSWLWAPAWSPTAWRISRRRSGR